MTTTSLLLRAAKRRVTSTRHLGRRSLTTASVRHKRFYCQAPKEEEPQEKKPQKQNKRKGFIARGLGTIFGISPKVRWILRRTQMFENRDVIDLVATTTAVGVWSFATVTGLGYLGIDTTALIAPFSVAGAAIGFGMKDIAQNYISGLLLVLNRCIQRGWEVTIAGSYRGEVLRIDLRHVHLLTANKEVITVPNGSVFGSPIIVHKNLDLTEYDEN